jgi:UMF1 family MFS transporter
MTHPPHAPPVVTEAGEIRPAGRAPARERWSWALYDFSNTIFSMNVASLYFGTWLVADLGASQSTYAYANAIASVMVVLAIPVLGAISDSRRRRVPWVIGFTLLSCFACAAIGVFGQTTIPVMGENVAGATAVATPAASALIWVLLAYVIANFAYQSAQPFYNAMLPELVPPRELGRLSGLGAAIGYVGSITGVILVMPFFSGSLPFGIALSESTMNALHTIAPFTSHGGRVSTFVPTGMLFLLFSLPLIVFCRDHNPAPRAPLALRKAFGDIASTLRDAKRYPGAVRFIVASLIYQDAVGTIISFMAIYAVTVMGFQEGSEVTLFLVLTVPAIVGTYVAGILVDRIGAKRTLTGTLAIWVVLLIAMIASPNQKMFWVVGVLVGFNFGAVNAAERPLLLTLIPDVYAGRYFSLMMLSARVAAIAGPLIWAATTDSLEPLYGAGIAGRAAVGTVALMFAIAIWVLRRVPDHPPGWSPPALAP